MCPREGCPKHMVMGPCGGVRQDGGCEVVAGPCVFEAPAGWVDPVPAVPLRQVPLILADYTAAPYSVPMLTAVAGVLAADCDAVLVGEHQNRPDFPPTLLASLLQAAGARPWMTLACRDRNRIVLEQELNGLRHLDVDAVLCTAGGPDAQLAMLSELRRVLRPAGRAGLLVFLAASDRLDNPPEGNHFPSRPQLTALIREAGLTEVATADAASFPDPPASWRERVTAVDEELRRRFGGAPALATAVEQSHRIGELLRSGELVSQVIRLVRPA